MRIECHPTGIAPVDFNEIAVAIASIFVGLAVFAVMAMLAPVLAPFYSRGRP